ncbi:endonuclease domain-containing protein [Nostoc sp. 2RC]|uniref:endonuclease domain-containing protein n=1 Tax=Nostoc sp. 2RC TaxID=2485484 RepID=UPI001628A477|nr:endonuclease domain-containing protein [Nostoc sp. 2RC]MBC1236858.1 DUF559 domain-containing protein [Nostoc sp. 2RC]
MTDHREYSSSISSTNEFLTSPPSPLSLKGEGGEEFLEGGEEFFEAGEERVKVGIWKTSPELWEKLKPLARQMRHKPTSAENHLWQYLRNRLLLGYKFRRQHSIDRFIVDFWCSQAQLIIEVDGAIHQYTQAEDAIRQQFLETQGYKILRFSNEAVLYNTNEVLNKIQSFLLSQPPKTSPSPSYSPSPSKERGLGGEVHNPKS